MYLFLFLFYVLFIDFSNIDFAHTLPHSLLGNYLEEDEEQPEYEGEFKVWSERAQAEKEPTIAIAEACNKLQMLGSAIFIHFVNFLLL